MDDPVVDYYLCSDWMTDPRMLEFAWEAATAARSELDGWSDAKARSVGRYLGKVVRFAHSAKWAIEVERRSKYLKKLTEGERLAVIILRLIARGDAVSDDPAEVAHLNQLHSELKQIHAAQAARIDLAPEVAIAQKHRLAQSKKARRSRGRGEYGRNFSDLFSELARKYPSFWPRQTWPHFWSLLEEWAGGDCMKKERGGQEVYEYPFGSRRKTISYKQFSERLRQARKVKKPV